MLFGTQLEDGNIAVAEGASGYGVIAAKDCMGHLAASGRSEERERDASLRAYEIVITEDYAVFEVDDTKGAAIQYEIGNPVTNNAQ